MPRVKGCVIILLSARPIVVQMKASANFDRLMKKNKGGRTLRGVLIYKRLEEKLIKPAVGNGRKC